MSRRRAKAPPPAKGGPARRSSGARKRVGADKPGATRAAALRSKGGSRSAAPAEQDPQGQPPASEAPGGAQANSPTSFPIVGIGASAGGLEALEQFLSHVPPKSGMAFVVIQHLDPTHKGAMVELLQRASRMPVVEVNDRQKVEADCVYVIPPNKDMSVLHGVLHLLPQTSPRGLNLPIDFFFRSLAADRQDRSIGVVLSGMGSDGTLGLRAIKEKAGTTFVQSLTSAKFDGMPRSAIDAGLADVVAAAPELPARIVAYHRHAPSIEKLDVAIAEKQQSALEKVLVLLRMQTGNDFSLYKRSTIQRRIERRMGLHQIDKVANYVRYLRENPPETELLFQELLIGVTSFFRDPAAWEHLRKEALIELLQARPAGSVIRAWVPACSTGEEAYSLAIVLNEAMEETKLGRNYNIQIFATDLDKEAIDKARQGIYPANIAADVSPERLRRYFLKDDGGFRVRKEIRDALVFAPQNVITDPPFTKLDILCCRNLLIYLSSELQKKLIPLFHYSLNPAGIMFLGSAETIGSFSGLFSPLDGKTRLYRRLAAAAGAPPIDFPSAFLAHESAVHEREGESIEAAMAPPANLQTLADRVIVQRFSPAVVLTSDKGDILYISGRTGKYLEPAVGKANLNIFAMAREGLRFDLSGAFASALRIDRPVSVRGVKVRTNGSTQSVDLTVQKLGEPRELRGTVMIVIADANSAVPLAPPPSKPLRVPANSRLAALELELQRAREEAQTTREEMQTSQEELQSTNEELQSTNEELTTSKEEMQSMNEELQTVNQELQSKVDDLARSNNDMRNLLNSTDIATLFLDGELLVRRFTTQTTKIIKLIPSDAGRPITDISTDLDFPSLVDDARDVLRTLVFKERQVSTKDGRWFTVRIMPYRTLDNVIDGLVLTFTDSTPANRLEATLREQASELRQLTESLPTLVWGCRPDGSYDYLSQQWVDYTGATDETQLGYGWLDHVHPDDRTRVRDEWNAVVRATAPLSTEYRIRSRDGWYRWFKARATPIRDQSGAVVKWYGTCTDVDDLKRAADARQESAERLVGILDWVSDAFLVLDGAFSIARVNAAARSVFGRTSGEMVGRSLTTAFPELAETDFDAKIREAGRQQRVMTATVRLESVLSPGFYSALIHPDSQGVSVLLKRADESR